MCKPRSMMWIPQLGMFAMSWGAGVVAGLASDIAASLLEWAACFDVTNTVRLAPARYISICTANAPFRFGVGGSVKSLTPPSNPEIRNE